MIVLFPTLIVPLNEDEVAFHTLRLPSLVDSIFTRIKKGDKYYRTEWEVMRDKFFGVEDYQLDQRYGLVEHEVDVEYYKNQAGSLVYVHGEFTKALKKAWEDFRNTQHEGAKEFPDAWKNMINSMKGNQNVN